MTAPASAPPPPLRAGDPIPWFGLPGNSTANFSIHAVAGRQRPRAT